MEAKLVEKCKFISYVLRHGASDVGVFIDEEGWVLCDDLLDASYKSNQNITYTELLKIINDNDKKRFSLSSDGSKIRALQGHSDSSVNMKFESKIPSDTLYHGTATRFLSAIMSEGLKKMSRQYVHLSPDISTATNVGKRYGKVVILKINTKRMLEDGFEFFLSENGVWLVESVPVKYIDKV